MQSDVHAQNTYVRFSYLPLDATLRQGFLHCCMNPIHTVDRCDSLREFQRYVRRSDLQSVSHLTIFMSYIWKHAHYLEPVNLLGCEGSQPFEDVDYFYTIVSCLRFSSALGSYLFKISYHAKMIHTTCQTKPRTSFVPVAQGLCKFCVLSS